MTFAPIIYVASLVCGIIIARKRHRWAAIPLCAALSFVGLIIALLLKTRCPNCREYHAPGAKVCPHCGRNTTDGKVSTSAV